MVKASWCPSHLPPECLDPDKPHGSKELRATVQFSQALHSAGQGLGSTHIPPSDQQKPHQTYLVDRVVAVFSVNEGMQDTEVAVRLPLSLCPPPICRQTSRLASSGQGGNPHSPQTQNSFVGAATLIHKDADGSGVQLQEGLGGGSLSTLLMRVTHHRQGQPKWHPPRLLPQ